MRNNLSELRREAEEYFRQVSQDLNAANEANRHILRMLDASLACFPIQNGQRTND